MPKHSDPPYISSINVTPQRYVTTVPKIIGKKDGEYHVKIINKKMIWTPLENNQ